MNYQESKDLTLAAELAALVPAEAQAWRQFDRAVEREDSLIPRKYRELIALGTAVAIQCAYCIDRHTRAARQAGASRAEMAEAVMTAAAIRSGATLGHGLLALKIWEETAQP